MQSNKNKKNKGILSRGHDQALNIKCILDQVLRESENLDLALKEAIVSVRDMAWNTHIRDQESQMPEWKSENNAI